MLSQLRRLGAETAVYGVSTIVGRFLTFLLVPFYTNVLAPGEYGIVTYLYSIIAFLNILYSYGMDSAYFKFSSAAEGADLRAYFSVPFLSVVLTSSIFSGLIMLFAGQLTGMLAIIPSLQILILYSAGILACDSLALIPFAVLRREHKAKQFAILKLFNIIVNVSLNIWFLLFLRKGIEAVFLSGFIASLSTAALLLPVIMKRITFRLNSAIWRMMIAFAVPTVPAGLAAMAVQVVDRPILRLFTDDTAVGIYQANYKLGIFMMLIVSMFDYAWRPFYFSASKDPGAKEMFARVLTYLTFFMCIVLIVLVLFIDTIAGFSFGGRHLIHRSYWSGLGIVPIVLTGYLFLGMYTVMTAGIYIEKQTKRLLLPTFAGAAANIAANIFLIPPYGIYGAAWATLIAYAVMAVSIYFTGQKIYPVPYEWKRMISLAVCTIGIISLFYLFKERPMLHDSYWIFIGYKLSLSALFFVSLLGMKFFSKEEIDALQTILRRQKSA